MITFDVIKRKQIDARVEYMKTKNPQAEMRALLLSSFVGDMEKHQKNYNKQMTELEIVQLTKQYLKNLSEIEKHGVTEKSTVERELLTSFLPPQKSIEEIENIINNIVQEIGAQSIKEFGKVMALLKQRHEGTYENDQAAKIIKTKLDK